MLRPKHAPPNCPEPSFKQSNQSSKDSPESTSKLNRDMCSNGNTLTDPGILSKEGVKNSVDLNKNDDNLEKLTRSKVSKSADGESYLHGDTRGSQAGNIETYSSDLNKKGNPEKTSLCKTDIQKDLNPSLLNVTAQFLDKPVCSEANPDGPELTVQPSLQNSSTKNGSTTKVNLEHSSIPLSGLAVEKGSNSKTSQDLPQQSNQNLADLQNTLIAGVSNTQTKEKRSSLNITGQFVDKCGNQKAKQDGPHRSNPTLSSSLLNLLNIDGENTPIKERKSFLNITSQFVGKGGSQEANKDVPQQNNQSLQPSLENSLKANVANAKPKETDFLSNITGQFVGKCNNEEAKPNGPQQTISNQQPNKQNSLDTDVANTRKKENSSSNITSQFVEKNGNQEAKQDYFPQTSQSLQPSLQNQLNGDAANSQSKERKSSLNITGQFVDRCGSQERSQDSPQKSDPKQESSFKNPFQSSNSTIYDQENTSCKNILEQDIDYQNTSNKTHGDRCEDASTVMFVECEPLKTFQRTPMMISHKTSFNLNSANLPPNLHPQHYFSSEDNHLHHSAQHQDNGLPEHTSKPNFMEEFSAEFDNSCPTIFEERQMLKHICSLPTITEQFTPTSQLSSQNGSSTLFKNGSLNADQLPSPEFFSKELLCNLKVHGKELDSAAKHGCILHDSPQQPQLDNFPKGVTLGYLKPDNLLLVNNATCEVCAENRALGKLSKQNCAQETMNAIAKSSISSEIDFLSPDEVGIMTRKSQTLRSETFEHLSNKLPSTGQVPQMPAASETGGSLSMTSPQKVVLSTSAKSSKSGSTTPHDSQNDGEQHRLQSGSKVIEDVNLVTMQNLVRQVAWTCNKLNTQLQELKTSKIVTPSHDDVAPAYFSHSNDTTYDNKKATDNLSTLSVSLKKSHQSCSGQSHLLSVPSHQQNMVSSAALSTPCRHCQKDFSGSNLSSACQLFSHSKPYQPSFQTSFNDSRISQDQKCATGNSQSPGKECCMQQFHKFHQPHTCTGMSVIESSEATTIPEISFPHSSVREQNSEKMHSTILHSHQHSLNSDRKQTSNKGAFSDKSEIFQSGSHLCKSFNQGILSTTNFQSKSSQTHQDVSFSCTDSSPPCQSCGFYKSYPLSDDTTSSINTFSFSPAIFSRTKQFQQREFLKQNSCASHVPYCRAPYFGLKGRTEMPQPETASAPLISHQNRLGHTTFQSVLQDKESKGTILNDWCQDHHHNPKDEGYMPKQPCFPCYCGSYCSYSIEPGKDSNHQVYSNQYQQAYFQDSQMQTSQSLQPKYQDYFHENLSSLSEQKLYSQLLPKHTLQKTAETQKDFHQSNTLQHTNRQVSDEGFEYAQKNSDQNSVKQSQLKYREKLKRLKKHQERREASKKSSYSNSVYGSSQGHFRGSFPKSRPPYNSLPEFTSYRYSDACPLKKSYVSPKRHRPSSKIRSKY